MLWCQSRTEFREMVLFLIHIKLLNYTFLPCCFARLLCSMRHSGLNTEHLWCIFSGPRVHAQLSLFVCFNMLWRESHLRPEVLFQAHGSWQKFSSCGCSTEALCNWELSIIPSQMTVSTTWCFTSLGPMRMA